MNLNHIFNFILSPTFSSWLLALKILFLVLALISLGFIIFALIKTSWLRRLVILDWVEFFSFRPYGIRKVVKTWTKITNRLETGLEPEYKLAVIKADSILDNILNRMGFGGEALGERLNKLTVATLPNREQVREAHKIRNNIVHDPDYRLDLDKARRVLEIYEQALRDLQVF